ncbi:hypothetical protein [Paeniglutamicibacter sp. NPDC091659]|uniref:hypothetical protein n=1 Tax=Paeniglutamicibacter sp. NPDC091659 TaxID=3364389 RepID=UPI00380DD859
MSTFANVGKLKGLQAVDVSTSKAMSYTVLSRLPKLAAVSTNVVSGKVNMTSLAKLPKLEAAGFSGNFNQSLKPLLKAKSMDSVYIERGTKAKKLAKGQKYTIPRGSGDAYIDIAIGWQGAHSEIMSVVSPGTGMADVVMMKIYDLGRLTVRDSRNLILCTPGKVVFDAPRVSQNTARAGETIRAQRPDSFSVNNWVDGDSKCAFQWQRDKKDIKGASRLNYTTTTADAGKTLRLETTCRPSAWTKKNVGFKANTKYSGAVKVS